MSGQIFIISAHKGTKKNDDIMPAAAQRRRVVLSAAEERHRERVEKCHPERSRRVSKLAITAKQSGVEG